MPKRFQPDDGPPRSLDKQQTAWSIASDRLTAAGQHELMRQIGRQLQADYQDMLKEPAPDRIRELLERLEARGNAPDADEL